MKNLKRFLAVTLACSLILGCEPESFYSSNEELESHYELNRDDMKLLNYYASIGISADRILFDSITCTIDGDMAVDKERMLYLIKNMPFENNIGTVQFHPELRQYGVISELMSVNALNVANIRYFVHSSISNCKKPEEWKTAISSAAKKWNDITNCRINFVQVTTIGTADLIISSDDASNTFLKSSLMNIESPTVATTDMPAKTLGSICKYIAIRRGSDPSNRLNAMMHELGHALGYYHSDGIDGIHIHGTSTSDNNSVMLKTISSNTTFTTGDLRAARLFYPDIILSIGGFSILPDGSGRVKMTITSPSTSYPIYWLKWERWNSSGTSLLEAKYVKCDVTTFSLSGIPKGTFKFRVCGYNYRKDVNSDFTIFKTVTVN